MDPRAEMHRAFDEALRRSTNDPVELSWAPWVLHVPRAEILEYAWSVAERTGRSVKINF